jgi:hypothetical protein
LREEIQLPPQLPKISFARLPSPPQQGTIQFFDGHFPALPAGTYGIHVEHTMNGPPGTPPTFKSPKQTFIVESPEFFIDTGIVQSVYPPMGGSDTYGRQLSFLILSDSSLPWERSLVPGTESSVENPTPWMALLIFAEGEIHLQPDSNNPVATGKVSDLLAASTTILKPDLPNGWVSADLLASQCQTITIPGAAFNALMPSTDDLRFLAHCRAVNTLDEGELLVSAILGNRLAVPNTKLPQRYFAHLISLEGFAKYLAPNGTPIPTKPDSTELMDVQLVSLFNWTFVSQPESNLGFEELMKGLIESEHSNDSSATAGSLKLPLPKGASLPPHARSRIEDGYAPLQFISGSGDDSFAWYRGPLSAVVPQALPSVGNPPVPVSQADSADELMIYLAEQGLFDLSYAAAWNLGRGVALADANFAQNVSKYRKAANASVSMMAQRMAMTHLAEETDARNLLARDASRRAFTGLMADGLGRQWTAALGRAREGPAPAPETVQRVRRSRHRLAVHPRHVLSQASFAQAVSEDAGQIIQTVAEWLANLSPPLSGTVLLPSPGSANAPGGVDTVLLHRFELDRGSDRRCAEHRHSQLTRRLGS